MPVPVVKVLARPLPRLMESHNTGSILL